MYYYWPIDQVSARVDAMAVEQDMTRHEVIEFALDTTPKSKIAFSHIIGRKWKIADDVPFRLVMNALRRRLDAK